MASGSRKSWRVRALVAEGTRLAAQSRHGPAQRVPNMKFRNAAGFPFNVERLNGLVYLNQIF